MVDVLFKRVRTEDVIARMKWVLSVEYDLLRCAHRGPVVLRFLA